MTWVTHHRFLRKLTNHRTLLCVHPIITTLKRIKGKACHLYMLCNWECVCAVFCGTGGDAEETYRISAAGESRASFLHLRAGGREPQPERTPKGTHRWGKTDFHFTFTQIFRMNGIYYIVKKLTSCISSSSNFSCNLISFFICVCLFYTLTGHNHEWWNSSTENMKTLQDWSSSCGQITAQPDNWERLNIDSKWKKIRYRSAITDHWHSK